MPLWNSATEVTTEHAAGTRQRPSNLSVQKPQQPGRADTVATWMCESPSNLDVRKPQQPGRADAPGTGSRRSSSNMDALRPHCNWRAKGACTCVDKAQSRRGESTRPSCVANPRCAAHGGRSADFTCCASFKLKVLKT